MKLKEKIFSLELNLKKYSKEKWNKLDRYSSALKITSIIYEVKIIKLGKWKKKFSNIGEIRKCEKMNIP